MIRAFRSRQFVLFLLTGGFAALVNFLSRIVYNRWVDFSTAVVLAYITGMITAFVLARIFVFSESRQSMRHSVFFFVLVNGVAVLQTWVISLLLAFHVLPFLGITAHAKEIGHAVGVIFPVFSSYLGHKRWSFR